MLPQIDPGCQPNGCSANTTPSASSVRPSARRLRRDLEAIADFCPKAEFSRSQNRRDRRQGCGHRGLAHGTTHKTGSKMGIMGLSDPTGHFEAVLFSEGLAQYRDVLEQAATVLLQLGAELQGEDVRAGCCMPAAR